MINLYADDTKIWREIHSESDHVTLQNDINYLLNWSIQNKMTFHPDKCKALMVRLRKPPLIDVLPFIQFMYEMGENVLDYCNIETDLGININGALNWTQHSNKIYSRANQRFAILRRTCSFIHNLKMKRILYLAMVRSLFEHCPTIWRPSSDTAIKLLESIQKRALKWIFGESPVNYSADNTLYYIHCKQLNILPIKFRFDFHDLISFHSIVYDYSCVKLPYYLSKYVGTRLRSSHLDSMCYVSSVLPRSENNCFSNSFFYRSHLAWNRLPLDLRDTVNQAQFRIKLAEYLWKEVGFSIRNGIEYEFDDAMS